MWIRDCIDRFTHIVLRKHRAVRFNADLKRLERFAAETNKIKLHFGCGPRVLKGWVNIDLAFEPYAEYLKYYGDIFYSADVRGDEQDFYSIDVTKEQLPLPDNSVDVIFHEDFIEHLDQRAQLLFLSETNRVLKAGGIHRVNTPDLKASMLMHSKFKLGSAGVYVQEWDNHGHKNVLTANMLAEMASLVGYREVKFNSRNGSISPDMPSEYRPDPKDRPEMGNIFADLIK